MARRVGSDPRLNADAKAMNGDWGFVVWIVVIAIPIGIALAARWARSRGPGAAMLDKPSPDDPRDPI